MFNAVLGGATDQILITYTGVITEGDFGLTDFLTLSSLQNPEDISQPESNQLLLQFGVGLDPGEDLEYTGTVAGVLTPQTITTT